MNPRPNPKATRNTVLSKRKPKTIYTNTVPPHLCERARNEMLLRNPDYVTFLSSLLRRSQLYHLWNSYLVVFRRFRLVSILIRLYSYLLLLLQFGTAFFFIAVTLVLLLPIALVGAGLVTVSALLFYGRKNRYMERELSGKNIFVLFPMRDGEFRSGQFWRTNIDELAKSRNGQNAVIVVSPFFWSFRGIFDRSPYFLVRAEKPNIYLIRKHYYFSLRKKVLYKNKHSLTLIF